jgi:hypothetical protein
MSFQKEFVKDFNTLFIGYINLLDKLAFAPEFEVAGKVIDISDKRKESLLKKAKDLLTDFNDIHSSEMPKFLTLVAKYNDLQSVEKKEIIRKEIRQYKNQLSRLLKIFNVKALVLLEELDENHLTFSDRIQLEKLKDLAVSDIENFWLNENDKKSPLT